jgi:sugar lactone lactonase YvrE
MQIRGLDGFTTGWGESLVWDEERQRLYFVDCAAQTLHWLEDGEGDPHTMQLPSMAAGLVPTNEGTLVAAMHEGLHVVDADRGTSTLLAEYPDELGGRCNDACADLDGNLVTGKLNLEQAEGSAWWFSAVDGWRLLDPDIANTNGPTVGVLGGVMTLVIGDTSADYHRYDYDPARGTVGPRSTFGDVSGLDGHPDGATLDADGGLWCALVGGSQLARFTTDGLDRTVALPVPHPTDVTFGGAGLDRLYVTSVGGDGDLDGSLLVVEGLGVIGRPEPRFHL